METAEGNDRGGKERDEVKVKLKTLKAVMEQCQRALEAIHADGLHDDDDNNSDQDDDDDDSNISKAADERGNCDRSSSSSPDHEAEELCVLIKSRLEGPDFLERFESAQLSAKQNLTEEGSSWDMVSDNDLWEGGKVENDQEEYVVVRQEDIVDGIACFMAAYLLSLKETKDLTPNQLQKALGKTFSIKKRKGKLRKAFDGTKVIYNVASWSATAIGIYQNPALLRVATAAFWTSCRVISRLF